MRCLTLLFIRQVLIIIAWACWNSQLPLCLKIRPLSPEVFYKWQAMVAGASLLLLAAHKSLDAPLIAGLALFPYSTIPLKASEVHSSRAFFSNKFVSLWFSWKHSFPLWFSRPFFCLGVCTLIRHEISLQKLWTTRCRTVPCDLHPAETESTASGMAGIDADIEQWSGAQQGTQVGKYLYWGVQARLWKADLLQLPR